MTPRFRDPEKARRRVNNVYHMLLYAWKKQTGYISKNIRQVGVDKSPTTLPELFAEILVECIAGQLKRGLTKSYQTTDTKVLGIKGRIHVGQTFGKGIHRAGQTFCSFDEFTEDIPINRVIKSTLRRIVRSSSVGNETKKRIKGILARLEYVADIDLKGSDFAGLRFDKTTNTYRLPISVCEFIYKDAFPTEDGTDMTFRSLSDETLGSPIKGKLFQDFVTGFIRSKMPKWRAPKPPHYERTHLVPLYGSSLDSIERLELDVLATSPNGTIHVIECKFYNSPFNSKYGCSAKVPNSHLLQLEAYLDLIISDSERGNGSAKNISGMLLYVTPEGASINADYVSMRYDTPLPVKIRCLDLTKHWEEVEGDLTEILNEAGT